MTESSADDVDPEDTRTWPLGTIVVRGGLRDVVHLAKVMTRDGSWSVVAHPGATFEMLCASIRHGTIRRTTVGRTRAAGGWLTPSDTLDGPPFHCELGDLTPATFDAILGPEEPKPVPKSSRWRGDAP